MKLVGFGLLHQFVVAHTRVAVQVAGFNRDRIRTDRAAIGEIIRTCIRLQDVGVSGGRDSGGSGATLGNGGQRAEGEQTGWY